MSEQDCTLLLWFQAPLQAWGHDSKFYRRDSGDFPTKSAVLGLILSAMGRGGAEEELLKSFAPLFYKVVAYQSNHATLLRDFHMVGSNYDSNDDWQKLMMPKTVDGKTPVGGGARLTYRYYLQDKAFAVIMGVPQEIRADVEAALQAPVWDIYLGRKNCPPTDFIYRGFYHGVDAAIEALSMLENEKSTYKKEFEIIDGESEEGEVMTINDIPVRFGKEKLYRERKVTKLYAGQ